MHCTHLPASSTILAALSWPYVPLCYRARASVLDSFSLSLTPALSVSVLCVLWLAGFCAVMLLRRASAGCTCLCCCANCRRRRPAVARWRWLDASVSATRPTSWSAHPPSLPCHPLPGLPLITRFPYCCLYIFPLLISHLPLLILPMLLLELPSHMGSCSCRPRSFIISELAPVIYITSSICHGLSNG